jgi:tetratricopeptide (TPR) repeat protein
MYLGMDGTGVPMRASELTGHAGNQPDGSAKTRERRQTGGRPRRRMIAYREAMRAGGLEKRFTWAFLAVLALGIGLAYGNSLGIGFYFDDAYGISNNVALRSLRNIPRFFTDPFTLTTVRENVDVRPVLVVTYAVNYAISGYAPWSYRVLNLIFHLLASALVFFIVRDHLWWPAASRGPEGEARWPAAAAALFFALAPLNTGAVDYMWARSALLCTLLYLGAFLGSLQGRRILGLLLHAAALLTKAIAVTLPVMLLVHDFLYRDRARHPTVLTYARDWKRLLLPIGLPAMLNIAYLLYRAALLPGWAEATRHQAWVTPWIWFVSQWPALLYYVRLFLWPDALSADHDFPYTVSVLSTRAWLSLVVLVGWIALALRAARRWPQVTFATLWFFITLAPESSFAALAEVINDHRPYIASSLGLSVLLAWALDRGAALLAGRARPAAFVAACVLLGVPAATLTHYRSWQWSDSLRIWEDAVAKGPGNGRSWLNAGLEHMRRGDLATARYYFERSRALLPEYPYTYMNLSVLEGREGHLEQSLAMAEMATRMNPSLALAHYYQGQALERLGRTNEAAAAYRLAVDLDSRDAAARDALRRIKGTARASSPSAESQKALMTAGLDSLYRRRDAPAAAALFRRVLELNPAHYGATFQLARALDQAGRRGEARPLWEKALRMAEGYHDAPTVETIRARLEQPP